MKDVPASLFVRRPSASGGAAAKAVALPESTHTAMEDLLRKLRDKRDRCATMNSADVEALKVPLRNLQKARRTVAGLLCPMSDCCDCADGLQLLLTYGL
jgi:hypothetical protein